MNQQNISSNLPVKRKRGRPRKDETLPRPHPPPPVAPAPPPPTFTTTAIQPPPPATTTLLPAVDHTMVGQAVTCIIDGIFDNGYLLSTRLGPNNAILRGIVFQQGHVAPVTPENDVAPQLEMCTRTEFPIPPANPRTPVCTTAPDQSVCVKPVAVQNYQNAPQPESLRLVEQDNVMEVFEVSKASEEAKDCGRRTENEDGGCESFPGKDSVIPEDITGMELEQHGNQDVIGMDHEPVVELEERAKEPGKVIAGTENQPSLGKDELEQESKEKTGEVNNVDANQDPSQAVAVDLSLSNFSEI